MVSSHLVSIMASPVAPPSCYPPMSSFTMSTRCSSEDSLPGSEFSKHFRIKYTKAIKWHTMSFISVKLFLQGVYWGRAAFFPPHNFNRVNLLMVNNIMSYTSLNKTFLYSILSVIQGQWGCLIDHPIVRALFQVKIKIKINQWTQLRFIL